MPTSSPSDYPARGNLVRAAAGSVVFNPVGTSYELKLATGAGYAGATTGRIDAVVRATARKLWTIGSGGNFVAPIMGPPRIVQGRIRYIDPTVMVVGCGLPVVVTLPTADSACNLTHGPLGVGQLVNVALLPGASLQLASAPTAALAT